MADKSVFSSEIKQLKEKVNATILPPELERKLLSMIGRLKRAAKYRGFLMEYERMAHYIDWVTALPWTKRSKDILDLDRAKRVLNKHHHGLDKIKDRILDYLAVLALKRKKGGEVKSGETEVLRFLRAPMLCFVGLVGTGKTTIAFSIAEAMGRKFARVPFGGLASPLDLRGQSRVHADAEPGLVMKAIKRCQTKNPVILLDEIDRVGEKERNDIMGVLVELLDPEQNMAFRDHYVDYPFDLSEVLFIATCNNTTNIATAVLDRLETMRMPSYSDDEKIKIGRDYVFPKLLAESGLEKDQIIIDEDVWPKIVRPLGYDAGIRTLQRTLNQVCRKAAREILEGKIKRLHLTTQNMKQYLPTW